MLYREKNLKAVLPGLTQQEKIRLLAEDGMLVKRPLLIGEGFVLAGFRQGQWRKLWQNRKRDGIHSVPFSSFGR